MTYKKIYMTFNIKRHMHAHVIFRWLYPTPLLSKTVRHWGVHKHRTGWRLVDVPFQVGLGFSRTNADSQWNPVCNVFHRNLFCGNETIRR